MSEGNGTPGAVRWRLLVPVPAEVDGRPVELTARSRAVLLALLSHPDTVVSAERLAEVIWGDEPPKTARNSIARFVADLRAALGPAGDRVVTEAGGYRVEVRPGELDVDIAATANVEAARIGVEDPEQAHELLAEGLALFGVLPNDALDELHDGSASIRTHDELRIAMAEADADLQLRLGRHRELIGTLEALVAAYPLHERFCAQLMLALYRSGRQADSLQAFHRHRQALVTVGLEPAPSIRRLETEILTHQVGEGDGQPPVAPAADPDGRIALPRSFAQTPSFRLVGRRLELARLRDTWRQSAAGSRRMILLGGESGIGKSRLATELGRVVHAEGAVVLLGRCDEAANTPYQPFADTLRHLVTHVPKGDLVSLLGPGAGELALLVPEIAGMHPSAPTSLDSETERHLLFGAITAWIRAQSRQMPMLLVLEDLHWADDATLRLLRDVLDGTRDSALLIVGTYRDSALDWSRSFPSFLADVRRQEGVSRLLLGELDSDGVADLIADVSGDRLSSEARALASNLYAATSGNPLYAVEMLASLVEQGSFAPDAGGVWRSQWNVEEAGIPEGVRGVVGRRLESLPDDGAELLASAAVVGEEFDADVVVAMDDRVEGEVTDVLEAARHAGLLESLGREPVRYRFSHAIVRQTLIEGLPESRRRRLHAAAATAIERLRVDLDDHRMALAHHWYEAASAPARAVEAILAAASQSLALSADEQARGWLRRAERLLDAGGLPDEVRIDVLTMLGEALRRIGDPSHREVLLDAGNRAASLGDGSRMAAAALANGRGWQSDTAGIDSERVAALEAAIAALGDEALDTRALLTIRLAVELVYEPDPSRRLALADEALAMARAEGDPYTIAAVLSSRPVVTLSHTTIDQRREESTELFALSEEIGDPGLRYYARTFAYFWHVQNTDVAGARAVVREADQIARTVGQPEFRWIVSCFDGALARLGGDLERAQSHLEEALAIGTDAGIRDTQVFDAIMRSALLVDRADSRSLEDLASVTAEMPAHYPGPVIWSSMLNTAVSDRPADLRALLDEVASSPYAPWSPGGGPRDRALSLAATVAVGEATLGEPSPWAVAAGDFMDPWRGQLFGNIAWNGPTESYLAAVAPLAGRPEAIEPLVAEALRICEEIGAPLNAVYARVFGACGLRIRGRAGDRDRADRLLARAVEEGDRLGAGFARTAAEHFPVLRA